MSRKEYTMEVNSNNITKTLIVKVIVTLCAITPKEIQSEAHVSKSYVSRYLKGERNCVEIDFFIIEKVFGIKVKDYSIND